VVPQRERVMVMGWLGSIPYDIPHTLLVKHDPTVEILSLVAAT
jgi:hypothetical protein